MDIRPVVKPLDITVKKEGGKVETSDVVRSLLTREYGGEPREGGS